MNRILLATTATLAMLAVQQIPAHAAIDFGQGFATDMAAAVDGTGYDEARRGRGSDDAKGPRERKGKKGKSGSGRDKPRIPGGSGCDDPGDLVEHPECRA